MRCLKAVAQVVSLCLEYSFYNNYLSKQKGKEQQCCTGRQMRRIRRFSAAVFEKVEGVINSDFCAIAA